MRFTPLRRTGVTVATLAGAISVLAGCGQTASPATDSLVVASADALSAAGSFRATVTTAVAGAPSGSGSGLFDWTNHSADLTVNDGKGHQQRVIITADAMYVHGPLTTLVGAAHVPADKPWLRFAFDNSVSNELNQQLFAGLDPFDVPTTLRQRVASVTSQGHDEIDGVAATHLRGQWIRSSAFLDNASGVVDVWFDQQGRLRRLVFSGSNTDGPVRITEDLSDFGVEAHVTPPPSDQVSDFDSVVAQALPTDLPSDMPTPPGGFPSTHESWPKPSGSWQSLGTGTNHGVQWQLFETRATHDGWCLSVRTTPDLGNIGVTAGADGSSEASDFAQTQYKGLPANCAVDPDDPAVVQEGNLGSAVVLGADSLQQNSDGLHYLVALAGSDVESMMVWLSGGSRVPAQRAGNAFIAIWSSSHSVTDLTGTTTGGQKFDCPGDDPANGPGEVTDIAC